jgi:hypothetical protein
MQQQVTAGMVMNRSIVSSPANSVLSRVASLAQIVTVAIACVVMSGLVAAGSVSGMNTSATTREGLISINRVNKGDKLTRTSTNRPSHNSTSIEVVVPHKRVPLGCDPAFSPFADPALAHIYKRCVA